MPTYAFCRDCGVRFELSLINWGGITQIVVDSQHMHQNYHQPSASRHLYLLCPACEAEEHD